MFSHILKYNRYGINQYTSKNGKGLVARIVEADKAFYHTKTASKLRVAGAVAQAMGRAVHTVLTGGLRNALKQELGEGTMFAHIFKMNKLGINQYTYMGNAKRPTLTDHIAIGRAKRRRAMGGSSFGAARSSAAVNASTSLRGSAY